MVSHGLLTGRAVSLLSGVPAGPRPATYDMAAYSGLAGRTAGVRRGPPRWPPFGSLGIPGLSGFHRRISRFFTGSLPVGHRRHRDRG